MWFPSICLGQDETTLGMEISPRRKSSRDTHQLAPLWAEHAILSIERETLLACICVTFLTKLRLPFHGYDILDSVSLSPSLFLTLSLLPCYECHLVIDLCSHSDGS